MFAASTNSSRHSFFGVTNVFLSLFVAANCRNGLARTTRRRRQRPAKSANGASLCSTLLAGDHLQARACGARTYRVVLQAATLRRRACVSEKKKKRPRSSPLMSSGTSGRIFFSCLLRDSQIGARARVPSCGCRHAADANFSRALAATARRLAFCRRASRSPCSLSKNRRQFFCFDHQFAFFLISLKWRRRLLAPRVSCKCNRKIYLTFE